MDRVRSSYLSDRQAVGIPGTRSAGFPETTPRPVHPSRGVVLGPHRRCVTLGTDRASGRNTGGLLREEAGIGSGYCRPRSLLETSHAHCSGRASRPVVFEGSTFTTFDSDGERAPLRVANPAPGRALSGCRCTSEEGFRSRSLSPGQERSRCSAIGLEGDQGCATFGATRRAGRAAFSPSGETDGIRSPGSGVCQRRGLGALSAAPYFFAAVSST